MNDKPTAFRAYQELADAYAANIDTKPHNAFYERPAMLSLLPEVSERHVLDVGCGPGVYAEELALRGAKVTACDINERMLELARKRLERAGVSKEVELRQVDLNQPLSMFLDGEFDVINAPLCLDYIADWHSLFGEFYRVAKPDCTFLFSCGHPAFDAEYFKTDRYFSVEFVECTWTGFGKSVRMPSYRRSLEEIVTPVVDAGFVIQKLHEPLPTEAFKKADPIRYGQLMRRPGFLCVRATKAS